MNCFICDFSCNSITRQPISNFDKELVADLVRDFLLLEIDETDIILCKTCLLLLKELQDFRSKAKTIQDLLTRQLYRKHNICDPAVFIELPIDEEAQRFFQYENEMYSCTKCGEFTTHHMDAITPHYKYHLINGDDFKMNISNTERDPFVDLDFKIKEEINCNINEGYIDDILNDTASLDTDRSNIDDISMESSNNKIMFKCFICHFNTFSKDRISFHMKTDHPNRKRITFLFPKTNDEENICLICGMANRNTEDCDHLKAILNKIKKIACEECDEMFYGRNMLGSHLNKIHFTCDICYKIFPSATAVSDHHNNKHKVRTYKCDVCPKSFKNSTSLKYHTSVHTRKYRLWCDICGRGKNTARAMREHLSQHTKEQLYTCDECGQGFIHYGTYYLHKSLHQDPYPFPCKLCPKKFSATSTRSMHVRQVHIKESPYVCEFCGKNYTRQASLKMHLQKHTGDFKYNCTICTKGFIQKESFAKHMRNKHNDHSVTKRVFEYKVALPPKKIEQKPHEDVNDNDNEDINYNEDDDDFEEYADCDVYDEDDDDDVA